MFIVVPFDVVMVVVVVGAGTPDGDTASYSTS